MHDALPDPSLRERKRVKTRQRIIECGLALFMRKGVEATTLDEVASAAEISRRTFFYYFKSKDDILMAWQDGAETALNEAVMDAAPGRTPLEAVLAAMIELTPLFETHDFLAIDKLLRSNEILRARKQAHYEHQERALFATLCRIWPEPSRVPGLRIVAMTSVGCLRLAIEGWINEDGRKPIAGYLQAAFAALVAEI